MTHETYTQRVTLSSGVVYKAWCPACGYLGHHWTQDSAEHADHRAPGEPGKEEK